MEEGIQLVGIDVGGTFTDFVWMVDGALHIHKESTTPADQSEGIVQGLEALGVADHAAVVHGTTVATNALLEYRGARTALVTTKGFADVLAIGRQNRPYLYRFSQQKPPPLVPEEWRFEVDERMDVGGNVLQPLLEPEVKGLLRRLEAERVESLAIVFLFSFINPTHERALASAIRAAYPNVSVSVSSELLPEYREFERTATTVVNAYVQPLVARYLEQLAGRIGAGRDGTRTVHVMQSSGGILDIDNAAKESGRLVLSGPAGGVVGAFEVARAAEETDAPHIITFDMGGTSTDVALCPGVLPRTSEGEIAGLPLRFPSMDIHTVGAGGGSIARVDAGGVLRVGPESAGANPGPVCYGRGGTEPTVTDANLVLGRIQADGFAGQTGVQLDQEAAVKAMELLGGRLEMTATEMAAGIIRVANAAMERALRKITVERGYDPRAYTLIPFGGAGPLHACALAEALGMQTILIPRYPGVLSALGLLRANMAMDASQAILMDLAVLESDGQELVAHAARLSKSIKQNLPQRDEKTQFHAWLDMRYVGQSFELEVPVDWPINARGIRTMRSAFHALHFRRFGYAMEEGAIEVVTLRVQGEIPGIKLQLDKDAEGNVPPFSVEASERRVVWLSGDVQQNVPYIERTSLGMGSVFDGPAVLRQYDTTLFVTDSWRVSTDAFQNIILRRI